MKLKRRIERNVIGNRIEQFDLYLVASGQQIYEI